LKGTFEGWKITWRFTMTYKHRSQFDKTKLCKRIVAILFSVSIIGFFTSCSSNIPAPSTPTDQPIISTINPTDEPAPTNTPSPTPTFAPPPPIEEIGQEWTSPKDGMVMVSVPEGEFTMGRDDGRPEESPAHPVFLNSFYIDKFEVTNQQYRICVESGSCSPLKKDEAYNDPTLEDHPVINVNLASARKYCAWVGKELPTEAEWEKAARGIDSRLYPWGNNEPDCSLAQFKDCGGQTVPVGSFPEGASPYGALDMAGNVWEWVSDEWQVDYYQNSPYKNPPGPTNPKNEWNLKEIRVFRGGSWSEDGATLVSTYRPWYEPNAQYYNLGFRCVKRMP
jgi:formylglycine-generating enzyme required for sulfatase activity